MTWTEEAAEEIAADIRQRQGIGNELEEIDDDIVEEMLDRWATIIRNAYDSAEAAAR